MQINDVAYNGFMSNKNIWENILSMIRESKKEISIWGSHSEEANGYLKKLSISPNSTFGNVIMNSGGIVVDNWIRIMGNGSGHSESIIDFNQVDSSGNPCKIENFLMVANDIVGGVFAINLGYFEEDFGLIWYFAPDTLDWESLSVKYSDFLAWCVMGNTDEFYSNFRWSDWKKFVVNIQFNNGVLVYPYLWSKEVNINTATKNIVPFDELFNLNMKYRNQFFVGK